METQQFCYCGNIARYNKHLKRWSKYCSPKCASNDPLVKEKIKKTCIEKYGVSNPAMSEHVRDKLKNTLSKRSEEDQQKINEKRKDTNLQKYGVDSVMKVDHVKEKLKISFIGKYGEDNPAKVEDIKNKIKETCKERYGVDVPAKNDDIKLKIQQTNIKKYGALSILATSDFRRKQAIIQKEKFYNSLTEGNRLQGKVKPLFSFEEYDPERDKYTEYLWECIKCGTHFNYYLENGNIPRCPQCYPLLNKGKSMIEKELIQSISNYTIIENSRNIIEGYELDIYLPDYKVAIEVNGIYWHSESMRKDKYYHLNKTRLCNNKGIHLIHIFEWNWLNNRDIVLSNIIAQLNRRGFTNIGARSLTVKRVSIQEEREFLNRNHLQGYVPSSFCIGLYKDNILLQLLSFGKPRFNKKHQWELLRSCTLLNHSIMGGFSKLLNFFIKENDPKDIISYCDRSIFKGEGYKKNGFMYVGETQPSYWYTKNYKTVENRTNYQKNKLKNKLPIFQEELTEWENMQLNGYDRIWDCGNLVFIWNK